MPHENFNREIGSFKGTRHTVEGEKFEGSDKEWDAYKQEKLPTPQDEIDLKKLFELEWIENKPLSTRQIESGIGATA